MRRRFDAGTGGAVAASRWARGQVCIRAWILAFMCEVVRFAVFERRGCLAPITPSCA